MTTYWLSVRSLFHIPNTGLKKLKNPKIVSSDQNTSQCLFIERLPHLASEPDSFAVLDGLGSGIHEHFDGLIVVDGLPAPDHVAQAIDGVSVTSWVGRTWIRHQANLKR